MSGWISSLLASTGFIVTNKRLVQRLGLSEAVLVGELCSEYNYWKSRGEAENGWFFSTVDNIERETGIKKVTQAALLKRLSEVGVLKYQRRGLPPKRHIFLDFDAIARLLDDDGSKSEPSSVQELDSNKKNKNKNEFNNISLEFVKGLCVRLGLKGMNETPEAMAEWFWKVARNEDGSLNYKGKEIESFAGLTSILRSIDLSGRRLAKARERPKWNPRPDEGAF